MTGPFRTIAERIRSELDTLEGVVHKVQRAWAMSRDRRMEQDLFLDAAALNLHSFYSGLEKVFLLIARHVDRQVPEGETWHRELLWQMEHDLPGVRPAVISEDTAGAMDVFRRFRHVVRNIYATRILPDRIQILVEKLPMVWCGTRAEFNAFARFLDNLADATEED